jgi:hypothetical protein
MKPKTAGVMVFCAFMFGAVGYVFAFGGLVFCCAPPGAGGRFWGPEKFFYGVLPMCVSAVALAYTARLWARAYIRRRNAWLAGCIIAIFAVAADLALFQSQRDSQDDKIKLIWKADSGAFSWGSGEVKLPAGFVYQPEHGIDTFVGRFTSQDGKQVIEYDIGYLAGEHGGMGRSETLSDGSRVRIGRATRTDDKGGTIFFSKVSFPDSGCANFYLESAKNKDDEAIEFIASSFRPAGQTPSWLRPLLPEVLRSACRYRFQLPNRW